MKTEASQVLYEILEESQDISQITDEYYGCGICFECGDIRDGCEPDAEGYECHSCGEYSVYGIEMAFMSLL